MIATILEPISSYGVFFRQSFGVIPVKTGIQCPSDLLDTRFRGYDGILRKR
jgi:hypothetical protein